MFVIGECGFKIIYSLNDRFITLFIYVLEGADDQILHEFNNVGSVFSTTYKFKHKYYEIYGTLISYYKFPVLSILNNFTYNNICITHTYLYIHF